MKGKIKVFVASLEISDNYVDTTEICKYCASSHRAEIVAQQLKHSVGSNLFLSNDQREIVNMIQRFCKENNFEREVVDLASPARATLLIFSSVLAFFQSQSFLLYGMAVKD